MSGYAYCAITFRTHVKLIHFENHSKTCDYYWNACFSFMSTFLRCECIDIATSLFLFIAFRTVASSGLKIDSNVFLLCAMKNFFPFLKQTHFRTKLPKTYVDQRESKNTTYGKKLCSKHVISIEMCDEFWEFSHRIFNTAIFSVGLFMNENPPVRLYNSPKMSKYCNKS